MALLKLRYKNILETSTVSLSAGVEDENYPLARLYDRGIAKFFSPSSAVTTEVKIDQGASPLPIDSMMIPSGHNLAGMTLAIKHSTDDISYSAAVVQWTGEAGNVNKEWSSLTKRYWKFIITSPASVPQIAELFLAATYTWERNPSRASGAFDPIFNVERKVSASGAVRRVVHGSLRRQRNYVVPLAGSTQRTSIEAFNTVWAGYKPFWICDHESAWIWGELLERLDLREAQATNYPFQFQFLECLE